MRKTLLMVPIFLGLAGAAADLSGNSFVNTSTAADLLSGQDSTEPLDLVEFEARWQGTVYFYGWMSAMSGETAFYDLPPVDFGITFEEFFESLNFFFMGFGELRRGRFGIATDFFYSDVSSDVAGPLGILDADLSSKLLISTVMAEYRVWEQDKSSVDVMAGARLWRLDSELDVKVGDGIFTDDVELVNTWVDPMIGVKTRLQGNSPFYLSGWAMIGGFGAASKIDWDVFGGVGYEFRKKMSILVGYRAIGVDYEGDDLIFNVIQHGPMVGSVIDF